MTHQQMHPTIYYLTFRYDSRRVVIYYSWSVLVPLVLTVLATEKLNIVGFAR